LKYSTLSLRHSQFKWLSFKYRKCERTWIAQEHGRKFIEIVRERLTDPARVVTDELFQGATKSSRVVIAEDVKSGGRKQAVLRLQTEGIRMEHVVPIRGNSPPLPMSDDPWEQLLPDGSRSDRT
jgi:hypothetical protein